MGRGGNREVLSRARLRALRRAASLGAVLLTVSLTAQAQSLLDTYRQARQADPRFRAAEFNTQAVATLTDQARAGFLPTVSADAEKLQTRQRILSSENPIFGAGSTSYPTKSTTLSIAQPLFRMEVLERYSQAKASVKQANYALVAAEQDLMLRTATAYLMVLAARDAQAFAKAEREAVGSALELATEKLKSGLGTVTNLHDATARRAITQAREIESRNKLNDALQGLREITGQTPTELQELRAEFALTQPEPLDLDRWVETALTQNLAVLGRREAVEVARIEIDRQKAGHYPSLNAVVTQNRKDSGSTLYGGGSNMSTTEVALRLTVPIYQGGLVQAVSKEAALRHQKAQEELEQERRGVERQTRAAFEGTVSGTTLVAALSQAVIAQQSAVQAKEQGQRSGLFTLLPVLDAQRDLFAARRDYAQSRYDYLLNRLKLAQAAGTLSESHLTELSEALQ